MADVHIEFQRLAELRLIDAVKSAFEGT